MESRPTREELADLRIAYQSGTRVKLDFMDDPYDSITPGTEGTVTSIDDMGTVHVRWDNGSGLGLVFNVDKFHKI
jgi:hypothetical protein